MADFEPQEKALRILSKQLLALEDIVRETREERNTTLGFEQLRRWKEMTIQLLADTVSETEAAALRNKKVGAFVLGQPLRNFLTEARLYEAFLVSMNEELQKHPDRIFTQIQPGPAAAPSATTADLFISHSGKDFIPHGRDAEFCRLAVDEARKSILEDDGKPMVGAVVAKDGILVAKAHRGEIPTNHAEYIVLELKLADAILAGASVYTTLEPCSKRTLPKIPCAERLVQRKVSRVFIGMLDPNPDIQGHGVRVLREANIEVQFFPAELMREIEELNRNFTRKFRSAPRQADVRPLEIRNTSPDEQKIADILKFKGKSITVFSKQKYGHGYLEGTFDAVLVDCDSLGVVLKASGNELSFSLSQIEVSRDLERKTLKLTVYR